MIPILLAYTCELCVVVAQVLHMRTFTLPFSPPLSRFWFSGNAYFSVDNALKRCFYD